jgi:hypothetical protein
MDSPITEYRVIHEVGDFEDGPTERLEAEVRSLLAEGWEVQGGVCVAHGIRPRDGSPYFYLFQAMVRKEQPPEHDKLLY